MQLRRISTGTMRVTGLFSLVVLFCTCARAAEIDSVMYADPSIDIPPVVKTLPSGQIDLWLKALNHSEADLQYRVALEITRAQRQGVTQLQETVETLIELLEKPQLHPQVQVACAQALVILDVRRAAPVLFSHAVHGELSTAQLIEPALARWGFEPIREIWLKRMSDPDAVSAARLLLAIEGVRAAGLPQSAERLRSLALASSARPDIRYSAAQALADLPGESLESDARHLSVDRSSAGRVDRLVAAALVSGDRRESPISFLLELAADPEPAVAAVAWKRILEIEPGLVADRAEKAIRDRDGKIRRLAAQALYSCPSTARIAQLALLLDDPLPDVRCDVRKWLAELASQPQFNGAVREAGMQILDGDRWRAVEQAISLLVALDHKPAAERFLELLNFKRSEVFVGAAWGLRRLAVEETLPRVFEQAKHFAESLLNWPANTPGETELDAAVCQIFQMFGQMKYLPATDLLLRFVPKIQPGIDSQSRLAAIWALGHLSAADPQPDLVSILEGRLADEGDLPPETPRVRRMAAVSLGRMQAHAALSSLRRFYESETPDAVLGRACGWAIERLTGETMPVARPLSIEQGGWSLMTLEQPSTTSGIP